MARTPNPPAKAGRLRRRRKGREGPGTLTRLRESYAVARKHDRRVLLWPVLVFVAVVAVAVAVGIVVHHPIVIPILGVIVGVLAGANLFAFRAQKAMYAEVADRPGVALEVVRRMRGDWKITEAVQFNRNQDFVHRIVSRSGVILLAEGRGHAVRDLLTTEARRTRRVASDATVHEVIVGSSAGQVPLGKLRPYLLKLPRTLKPAQVKALDVKLKAVARTSVPLPKGPLPTRVPRGKVR